MRKILISVAAAASALAVATPAAAQYYPAPPPPPGYGYGSPYGAPYGNAYGYQNNWGMVRSLQARVDNLQRQIRQLDRRRLITSREARSLRDESRAVEYRLRETARNGLSPREHRAIEVRLARLEHRIQREVMDGRRNYRGYSQYRGYGDRDRDGRIDRYEDDRGRDRDDD